MDAKKFYREIGNSSTLVSEPPEPEKVENSGMIYRARKSHTVTVEEIRAALDKAHKWKSPEIDKIPNFLSNALSYIHHPLSVCINELLSNPLD